MIFTVTGQTPLTDTVYRLELAGEAFRARVGEGYRALAKEEGVCAVPAAGSEEEVFAFLRKDLDRFL